MYTHTHKHKHTHTLAHTLYKVTTWSTFENVRLGKINQETLETPDKFPQRHLLSKVSYVSDTVLMCRSVKRDLLVSKETYNKPSFESRLFLS